MKHVIIGTAGHVDHGKTTLIQALTGTNPDRLKEEQERGMTIDIGFAYLKLPDGAIAGIVDVPGHERFLKNMLAGVSGVDVVLLVIAADEGIMPQTREHLDILRLLDVKNGVVALTKMDIVEKEWTDIVEEDVRSHLAGSFLVNAPIIRVSAATGKGLDALKRSLMSAVSRADARNASLPFRLPIDRVFTRPGFGTVVTGTLVAGSLQVGDAVELVPQQLAARIRGLQIHGLKVQEAGAGSRVAINLAGVEIEAISRGTQLVAPGSITPTRAFDARLRLLPALDKPLKDRTRVRVYLGTEEVLGRVRLLDERTELEAEGTAFIQFRAEKDFASARGDRFVLRTYSPMITIGGGIVLDSAPPRHRKADADTLKMLAAKERGTPEDILDTLLQRSPFGILTKDLSAQSGISLEDVGMALPALLQSGQASMLPTARIIHTAVISALTNRAREALEAFHQQFPLRPGLPKEELKAILGRNLDPRAYSSFLYHWQAQNLLIVEAAAVRLVAFHVELNERQQSLLQRIEEFYVGCGIAAPTIEEVCQIVKAPPDAVNALLRVGVEQGRFQKVSDGIYYASETVKTLQQLVRDYVREHGSITVGAFRDLTNSNRKFALLALEHFDSLRFTLRQGDERILSTTSQQ